MDEKTVKANLRKLRESRGLSQDDVAALVGLSVQSYRRMESGKTLVVNKVVWELAKVYKVSVGELLLGSEGEADSSRLLSDYRAEYEGKEEKLMEKIASLEDLVCSQREPIEVQKQIISMLYRQMGEAPDVKVPEK